MTEEILTLTSEKLKVPLIEVFRVANFYKAFSLKPRGKHLLTVCMGTACHVRGAPRFLDEVLGQLKVKPGDTTEDGEFTVETVNCLGACALGPVVVLDGKYYDHMTTGKLRDLIQSCRSKSRETFQNDLLGAGSSQSALLQRRRGGSRRCLFSRWIELDSASAASRVAGSLGS